ncbi:MAG: DUF6624 domain-containing protein [Candidatus Cyclobacteriaceae bacterium M2_1C_046]
MCPIYKLILLVFLLPITLSAQDRQIYISKADSLYKIKSYKTSGEFYDKAFNLAPGDATEYYNAACAWSLSENKEAAIKYLHHSADKGYKNIEWIKKDNDLKILNDHTEWNNILEKIATNKAAYEKDFDKPLQKQLEKIYIRDQLLRQLFQDAEAKFGKNSEEMEYFWSLMAKEDSLALLEVTDILENRGWPGKSLVGGKANHAVFMVIQHAPLEIQEKYLPLMKASVEKGESSGRNLAMLIDRVRMHKGEKQLYGSQLSKNNETGQWELYPIESPEKVNERRAEVGLGPIEDYLKKMGIK